MKKPKLIMLCGICGSGKSTFGKKYADENNYFYVSSDEIRKELYGDESIQGNPQDVFGVMQDRTLRHLYEWQSVVYDATNLTRKDRSGIISACPRYVELECHIIWCPIDICIKRDENRDRTVGKSVIDRMVKRFQMPFYDEGFDSIIIEINCSPEEVGEHNRKVHQSLDIDQENPNHTLTVRVHCNKAFEYAIDKKFPNEVATAAMFHDFGKPYTKSKLDKNGNECSIAHYYSHQNVSAYIACGMVYGIEELWLISTHMDYFLNTKYYNRLPNVLREKLDMLHECDVNAK